MNRLASIRKRGCAQRILDWFFGYDFFISYRWLDGRTYALALAEELNGRGFSCFLDSDDYNPGDNWKTVGERSLKNTSFLVLVGSPKIHESYPVQHELRIFSKQGGVIPIDIGFSVSAESMECSPLAPYLPDELLRIDESISRLDTGPSETAIEEVERSFKGRRRSVIRRRTVQLLAGTFATVMVIAVFLWCLNYYQSTANLVDDLLANSATDVPSLAATNVFAQITEEMLSRRRFVVMWFLKQKIDDIPPDGNNVLPGKKRADLAIALVHLNRLDNAVDCLVYPDTRTETLAQFAARCKSPGGLKERQLITLAEHAVESSSNRSADLAAYSALLGIGEFVSQPMSEQFLEKLKDWYLVNPSRAVHSACGWLLGDDTCERINARVARAASRINLETGNKEWLIVKLESSDSGSTKGGRVEYVTFIRFCDGNRTFAVADREATVGVCRQLVADRLEDLVLDDPLKYQLNDPVDAVEFIITDRQSPALLLCDEFTKRFPKGVTVRLPNDTEWAIAWGRPEKHKSQSFQFGNDDVLLSRYAIYGPNPDGPSRVSRVASRRPSMTGMFDVHGNVSEWTIESTEEGEWETLRGGSVGQNESECAWNAIVGSAQYKGLRFVIE